MHLPLNSKFHFMCSYLQQMKQQPSSSQGIPLAPEIPEELKRPSSLECALASKRMGERRPTLQENIELASAKWHQRNPPELPEALRRASQSNSSAGVPFMGRRKTLKDEIVTAVEGMEERRLSLAEEEKRRSTKTTEVCMSTLIFY